MRSKRKSASHLGDQGRLKMKSIKEIINLHLKNDVSVRQISRSLSLPRSTIADYLHRYKSSDLSPDDIQLLDDDVIELNGLYNKTISHNEIKYSEKKGRSGYGLPVCIQSILQNGVEFDQRVVAFRIAVHLKRVGLPEDCTVAALLEWKRKNKPINNKLTITTREIHEQVEWAYKKEYTGYGCQDSIIQAFCDPRCPIKYKIN